MDRPFMVKDRVTVHGLNRPYQGRVICTNRKSRYDENVVVLYDDGETEHVETFKPDGTRYGGRRTITLGWLKIEG